jgi:hypothetical protein
MRIVEFDSEVIVLSLWMWIEHKLKVFGFSMSKVYDDCAFASTTSLLGVCCNCNQPHQTAEIEIGTTQQSICEFPEVLSIIRGCRKKPTTRL